MMKGRGTSANTHNGKEPHMTDHVYKHIDVTGTSKTSSDDAIRTAIERASKSVRDMRWFEVTETRGHIEDQKVAHWQVTVRIGFTIED